MGQMIRLGADAVNPSAERTRAALGRFNREGCWFESNPGESSKRPANAGLCVSAVAMRSSTFCPIFASGDSPDPLLDSWPR
jgi:hypothetical protein